VFEGCSGVRVPVASGDLVSVGAGVKVNDGQGVIPVGEGIFVSAIVGDSVVKLCVAVGPSVIVGEGLTTGDTLGLG